MRGDLDEKLARLARRDEALRRRSTGPGGADRGNEARPAEPPNPREGHGAHRPRGPQPDDRDPVEEVAEAVRRVVAEHPGMAVTLRVEHDGQAYPLRVCWAGADGTSADPAARLAELIRRNPSLLDDTGRLP